MEVSPIRRLASELDRLKAENKPLLDGIKKDFDLQVAVEGDSLEQVCDKILEAVVRAFGIERCLLFVADHELLWVGGVKFLNHKPDRQLLNLLANYRVSMQNRRNMMVDLLHEGLDRLVIQNRKRMQQWMSDLELKLLDPGPLALIPIRSASGRPLGVLGFDEKRDFKAVTDDFLGELGRMLHAMSYSLEQAIAKRRLDIDLDRFSILNEITRSLNTTQDRKEIIGMVLDMLMAKMGVDAAAWSERQSENTMVIRYDRGLKKLNVKRGPHELAPNLGSAFKGPRIWRSGATRGPFIEGDDETGGIFSSCIHAPVLFRDRLHGVLSLVQLREYAFAGDTVRFLKNLCDHVGVALNDAELFHKVELLSFTDGLTGLYNHRYFQDALLREIRRAKRYKHAFSLLVADIDRFKRFNDSYGHQEGDTALKLLADIFRQELRNIDIAARYGGEEFAVILPETDAQGAFVAAERIRKRIADTPMPVTRGPGRKPRLTVSIGAACFPEDADDNSTLIFKADMNMYEAKRRGRNQVIANR